jgi:hypothetical protein
MQQRVSRKVLVVLRKRLVVVRETPFGHEKWRPQSKKPLFEDDERLFGNKRRPRDDTERLLDD